MPCNQGLLLRAWSGGRGLITTSRPEVGRSDDHVSQVRAGGQWGPARDLKSRQEDFETDEKKCGRESGATAEVAWQ